MFYIVIRNTSGCLTLHFAISFEFHLLAQKFQFRVIIYSVIESYVTGDVCFQRHENEYTLVVNSLCTVQ
jgi:hypothetical protein